MWAMMMAMGNDAETGAEQTYEEEAFVDAMEYEESDYKRLAQFPRELFA